MCPSAERTSHSARSSTWVAPRSAISSTKASGIGATEPKLTPMRIGTCRSLARVTTSRTSSGLRMLPGLRRSPWIPASSAFSASVCSKWMSAISGTGECGTMSGSAAAALRSGTAMRTISQPASASS